MMGVPQGRGITSHKAMFSGVEVIQSQYLTVTEERTSLHPDWMDRQARNYGRWMGGRHRLHECSVPMEPLEYTHSVQVPDPQIYRLGGTFYAHPATYARAMAELAKIAEKAIRRDTETIFMRGYL